MSKAQKKRELSAKAGAKAPEKTGTTKAPETKAPETKAPETKAPETKAPETKAPETTTPKKEAPVQSEAAPKWFSDFAEAFNQKMDGVGKTLDDHDERISAIEKLIEEKGCRGVPVTAAPKVETTAEAAAKTEEAAEAAQKGSDEAKAEGATSGQASTPVATATEATAKVTASAVPDGWRPAKAYKYWNFETGAWGGPLLDIFAAKQAGGGTTSGYEPVWVWVYNGKIKRLMTTVEIDAYTPQ